MKILDSDEHGRLVISKEANEELTLIENEKKSLQSREKELRSQILDAMIANNIDKTQTTNFIFTQLIPKDNIKFDVDRFLLIEHSDIIGFCTTFEESKHFDEEKFKEDNPELYKKYVKTNITPNVNVDKLKKKLPDVYKKYVSTTTSNRPVSLMIRAKKDKE